MVDRPYGKFAELYDALMDQHEFYESYYHFAIGLIGNAKPAILDLGCGTGQLAKLFKDGGYNVEGIDLSAGMLKVARGKGIKVHKQGMAGFSLAKKYGFILSTFDSVNYLKTEAELRRCFASVYQHLNPGGLFVFDLNSSYKISNVARLFGRTAQYMVGSTKITWTNSHARGRWIAELRIFSSGRGYYEKHVERAFMLATVKKLLRQCGFEVLKASSDFSFSPIARDSLKWFFVCGKKHDNAAKLSKFPEKYNFQYNQKLYK